MIWSGFKYSGKLRKIDSEMDKNKEDYIGKDKAKISIFLLLMFAHAL
jgi:hypothetical protein